MNFSLFARGAIQLSGSVSADRKKTSSVRFLLLFCFDLLILSVVLRHFRIFSTVFST